MAIVIFVVAALALSGSIGAFLLYVPMMSFVVVTIILLGLVAMFVMGLHLGAKFASVREDEISSEAGPGDDSRMAHRVVEVEPADVPIAKSFHNSAEKSAAFAENARVREIAPFRPRPLSARPIH